MISSLRRTSFRLIFSILISSVLFSASAVSQVLGRPDTARVDDSFWSRHSLSKVAAVGLTGATLVYSWGVWWKNDFGSFKFRTDTGSILDAHLMIDKIGHFYTSYFMFRAIHRILLWGDHSKTDSFWWATGVSAFHGLAVEVGDGFSNFGFDHEDLLFNWAGVGYGMLQQQVPVLQNFQIKWSLYYPLSRHAFKINLLYDYHIYWLSVRVNELLPQKWEPYWPDFFQIAVGYSSANQVARREYVLGLDYNLELLPIKGRDASLILSILNMFHIPAPGVKFSPGHSPEYRLFLLH